MDYTFDLKGIAVSWFKQGRKKTLQKMSESIVVLAASELQSKLEKLKEKPDELVHRVSDFVTRERSLRDTPKNKVHKDSGPKKEIAPAPELDRLKNETVLEAEIIE